MTPEIVALFGEHGPVMLVVGVFVFWMMRVQQADKEQMQKQWDEMREDRKEVSESIAKLTETLEHMRRNLVQQTSVIERQISKRE